MQFKSRSLFENDSLYIFDLIWYKQRYAFCKTSWLNNFLQTLIHCNFFEKKCCYVLSEGIVVLESRSKNNKEMFRYVKRKDLNTVQWWNYRIGKWPNNFSNGHDIIMIENKTKKFTFYVHWYVIFGYKWPLHFSKIFCHSIFFL